MELLFERKKSLLWLDARTKFVVMICSSTILAAVYDWYLDIAIFAFVMCIGYLLGEVRITTKFTLAYGILAFLRFFVLMYCSGFAEIFIRGFSFILMRMLPMFLAAVLLILTTTVSEFIAAFRRAKIPDAIVIPLSVIFRFIPTIKEEWISIRQAMKFRGIGTSLQSIVKNPMQNLEYVLIPVMMSTATIAEELAAASMSRGLATGVRRTIITDIKLRFWDYFILISYPCLVFLAIFVF